jgi:hypothetical protein
MQFRNWYKPNARSQWPFHQEKVYAYSETARRRRIDDSRPDQNSFAFGICRTDRRCLPPRFRRPRCPRAKSGLGTRAGRSIGHALADTHCGAFAFSVRKLKHWAQCLPHDAPSGIAGNSPGQERLRPATQALRSARSNAEFATSRKIFSPCARFSAATRREKPGSSGTESNSGQPVTNSVPASQTQPAPQPGRVAFSPSASALSTYLASAAMLLLRVVFTLPVPLRSWLMSATMKGATQIQTRGASSSMIVCAS